MIFEVEITEVYKRKIIVEAEDSEIAENLTKKRCKSGIINLSRCNDWSGRCVKATPLCVQRLTGVLIERKPEIVEVCPECGQEVTMEWDVVKDGYSAFCPYCGAKMYLCDECMHEDGECSVKCDYDENGECYRTRKNSAEGKFHV